MSTTDIINEDTTKIAGIEIMYSDCIEGVPPAKTESIEKLEKTDEIDSKKINDFLRSSGVEPEEVSDVFDVPFPFSYDRSEETETP